MRLAEAELKKTADRLAKRWKWVEIHLDPDWDRIHTLHKLPGLPGTPTAAERKRLDELADEMQDITDNPPMDPAEHGTAYARSEDLNAKHEKLEARIAARSTGRRTCASLDASLPSRARGREVITGLVLPEDVPPKPKKAARKKADAPADAPDVAGAKPVDPGEEPAAPPPTTFEEPCTARNHQSPEVTHAKAAGLSTAVIDDLAAIRTASYAPRFDVAFDLAAYLLVMDTSTRLPERPADTGLRPTNRNDEADFADANPGEKLHEPPAGRWMKLGDDLKRFDALRALPTPRSRSCSPALFSAALLQPSRQPSPRAAHRRARRRAPRHRLRRGRPIHREVLLEAADPRPDVRDRAGRPVPPFQEGGVPARVARGFDENDDVDRVPRCGRQPPDGLADALDVVERDLSGFEDEHGLAPVFGGIFVQLPGLPLPERPFDARRLHAGGRPVRWGPPGRRHRPTRRVGP